MEPAQVVNMQEASQSAAPAPQVQMETTAQVGEPRIRGSFVDTVTSTDIQRINGYLRIGNIAAGSVVFLVGFVGMFSSFSYSDFLVTIMIMLMGISLVGFEFRDRFSTTAEKAKTNFAFFFTAFGRAISLAIIGLFALSQGWFGVVTGLFVLLLSAFNFFIIKKHPGFKETMTQPSHVQVPQQEKSLPVAQVVV